MARNSNGQFQRGRSGNPGGRPKAVVEVQNLAREHTTAALERLATIARESDNESAVVAACKELLDRAWGRAPQKIEGGLDVQITSPEQAEAARAKLRKLATELLGLTT